MSISPAEIDRLRRVALASLHEHWRFYLIEGIILIALGAAAIIVPPIATLAVTIFVGWLFLISGVVGLFTTFRMRGAPGFWWSLISAVLAIVVGGMLVAEPIRGAVSLTLLLIAFFIIEGVVSVMFALDHRKELPGAWGWMLASGVVDLALANGGLGHRTARWNQPDVRRCRPCRDGSTGTQDRPIDPDSDLSLSTRPRMCSVIIGI